MLAKTVRECSKLADGRRALDDAWGISLHHRIQASPGFDAAVEFARGLLEEAGLEVQVHDYPADGRTEYWGWVAPIGWEVRDAELWMVEPEKELIANLTPVEFQLDWPEVVFPDPETDKPRTYGPWVRGQVCSLPSQLARHLERKGAVRLLSEAERK